MSGPINIKFNENESLIDTIDTVYVLHGPNAANNVLQMCSSKYLDNRKFGIQYLKHSLKFYKTIYLEDPLNYTKEQIVTKSSLVSLDYFRVLARIASIKFGVSIVSKMCINRIRVIDTAPPKFKDVFHYEDINSVLSYCVTPSSIVAAA